MLANVSDLWDRREVCRFFGGSKPLDPATIYRGIRQGRFPLPVKVGGSIHQQFVNGSVVIGPATFWIASIVAGSGAMKWTLTGLGLALAPVFE